MVNFGDKFGLPKDRFKLEKGLSNFDIVKIEIIKSKKLYDVREETEAGTKVTKKLIDIAYIDCEIDGEIKKFYAPNAPIVDACKDILKEYGKKDGSLTEPVRIQEVKEEKAEGSKNAYLYFT